MVVLPKEGVPVRATLVLARQGDLFWAPMGVAAAGSGGGGGGGGGAAAPVGEASAVPAAPARAFLAGNGPALAGTPTPSAGAAGISERARADGNRYDITVTRNGRSEDTRRGPNGHSGGRSPPLPGQAYSRNGRNGRNGHGHSGGSSAPLPGQASVDGLREAAEKVREAAEKVRERPHPPVPDRPSVAVEMSNIVATGSGTLTRTRGPGSARKQKNVGEDGVVCGREAVQEGASDAANGGVASPSPQVCV